VIFLYQCHSLGLEINVTHPLQDNNIVVENCDRSIAGAEIWIRAKFKVLQGM
jgi:hypothetical protein